MKNENQINTEILQLKTPYYCKTGMPNSTLQFICLSKTTTSQQFHELGRSLVSQH